jgi:hypothetical protein
MDHSKASVIVRVCAAVAFAAATPSHVRAQTITNERVPVELVAFNPCHSGGFIFLTGELHRVIIESPNGTSLHHSVIHASGQDEAGTPYRFADITHVTALHGESNFVSRQRLVSPGPGANVLALTVIESSGEFIAELECVGQ